MGRPIKSKYFGPFKGAGGIGEGVLSVTITGGGTGLTGTNTVLFTSPTGVGGVIAAGQVVLSGANTVTSVTITSSGSGYTTAPGVVFVSTLGSTATGTANLTSRQDVITCRAYIPAVNGGLSAVAGDIDEQVASRKYRVQTAQGTGPCKLVTTSTLVAGEMNISATDTNGSTYYVKKLTARRAVLVQTTASGSFLFNTNQAAGWSTDAASAGVVLIENS